MFGRMNCVGEGGGGGGTQRPFSQLPLPTCDYVSLMCLYAGQQLNASIKYYMCTGTRKVRFQFDFYSVHMYDRRDHFK